MHCHLRLWVPSNVLGFNHEVGLADLECTQTTKFQQNRTIRCWLIAI